MVAFGTPALLEGLAGSCAIEASAGTGKTYTLEHLVVQLILQGTPLEKILVVTFTRKATLELKARVRAKLAALAALEADDVKAGEIPCELTPERRDRLRAALMAFDRATISTIHGFCQQVLQDGAFEGGRLFRQEAIASDDAFDRAFTTLLRTHYATRHGALLRVALGFLGGPAPLRDLLKEALREDGLDLPAFTDARTFLEAFPADRAQACLADPGAFGFPKANARSVRTRLELVLARRDACLAGVPEDFWLDKDWIQDKLLDNLGPFTGDGLEGDTAVLAQAVREVSNVKAILAAAFLPPLREELRRFKDEEGLFDFDDMIGQVAAALEGPQGEVLAGRLRERFHAALIDEFQDTDARQWAIFRRIFLGSPGHRLFLVGDPKQAIYGFRGGDLPTYVEALDQLKHTGAGVLSLDTNFRSTEGVIRGYNALFEETGGVPFFTGANAGRYPRPVGCGRPSLALTGAPAIRVVDVPVADARGTRLRAADALARALEATLAAGRFNGEPLGPGDVFALTQTLAEGRIMADALRARGIPAALYRQEGLFDGPEAQACRDLMLAIDAPLDECRRAKALLGPFFGLNLAEAERARSLPEGHPILTRLFGWRELAAHGRFGEMFNRVVSESGLSQRLLFLDENQRALTNLLHILELLQRQALGGHCTLAGLAVQVQRWIDGEDRPAVEEGDTQRLERAGGAVQVLTMHKAKGLQAPVVLLSGGLSLGSTKANLHRYHLDGARRAWVGPAKAAPARVQALIDTEAAEEGERLAYVALTRAEAQLILPCYVPGEGAPATSFEPGGDPRRGLYRGVNRRLRTLLDGAPRADFERLPAPAAVPPAPVPDPGPWTLELPPPLDAPAFPSLRKLGRPVWTFSYSSLQKGLKPGWGEGAPLEEVKGFTPTDGPAGGRKFGTQVHAALQHADLASFAGADLDTWIALPSTQALAADRLPEEGRREALRWIHQAMTLAHPLPDGTTAVLHACQAFLRELDFLTPFAGRQDFLHGSMDVLFQAGGKAYVLDWKTNRLNGYDPATLEQTVQEHYWLQVQIYATTACRFLDIRDEAQYEEAFGGVVYVFLRGLPEGGLWTLRPSWAQLRAWEAELEALPADRMIPPNAGGEPRDR